MKNAFYFMLQKLSQFLRYSHFCPDFLVIQENGLVRKLRLISKFVTSQTGQQIITLHVSPNISRSKGNQTMKFGQLIKYNGRNSFHQKSCRKQGRETSSRPLLVFLETFIKSRSKRSTPKFQYVLVVIYLDIQ